MGYERDVVIDGHRYDVEISVDFNSVKVGKVSVANVNGIWMVYLYHNDVGNLIRTYPMEKLDKAVKYAIRINEDYGFKNAARSVLEDWWYEI